MQSISCVLLVCNSFYDLVFWGPPLVRDMAKILRSNVVKQQVLKNKDILLSTIKVIPCECRLMPRCLDPVMCYACAGSCWAKPILCCFMMCSIHVPFCWHHKGHSTEGAFRPGMLAGCGPVLQAAGPGAPNCSRQCRSLGWMWVDALVFGSCAVHLSVLWRWCFAPCFMMCEIIAEL